MGNLELFKTKSEYDEVSYKLDYPCVSYIEEIGDVAYEEEPSWVKCTYEIPQEALDEGTTSFTIMNNAESVVKAYKVNGEMVDIEPEKVEEGVQVDVFQPMEMEGFGSVYIPSLDSCPLAETITTATTFNISRQVDVTSDYLLMALYDNDTLAGLDPIPIAELGAEYLNMFYTFSEDGLSYSYTDMLIQELGGQYIGYGFGIFIVDADYIASNTPINPPSLTTTMVGSKVSGGLRNIEIDQSVLGEGNRFVIEYKLKNDVNTINSVWNPSITVGESTYYLIKELDLRGLSLKKKYVIGVDAFYVNAYSVSFMLDTVHLGDSITEIGNNAFNCCKTLTSVTIGNSVTSIGNNAFGSCSSLTSVVIPDSVTTLDAAFAGCSNLTSVTIGSGVTSIDDYAFNYCSGLTSVVIPDNVTSIGNYAFGHCTSLTSINIPDSVTEIGSYAFSSCYSLTSITIPDSVTSIGGYAFTGCSNLTSINIPRYAINIGSNVLYNCDNLQNIILDTEIIKTNVVPSYLRNNCNLIIGEHVKEILCSFPLDASNLTIITKNTTAPKLYTSLCSTNYVDGTLFKIDYPLGSDYSSWMWNMTPRKYLLFNEYEYNLLDKALYDYDIVFVYYAVASDDMDVSNLFKGMYNININGENTSVCTQMGLNVIRCNLTNTTLATGKTSPNILYCELGSKIIEISHINGLQNLQTIVLPSTLRKIHEGTFINCSSRLKVKNLPYNGQLQIEPTNGAPSRWNGRNYLEDYEYLISSDNILYWLKTDAETYNIPNNVISIQRLHEFYKCIDAPNLTSITIPDSVTSIGDSAFSGCTSLTSVVIPDSVTSIGGSAFYNCKNLTIENNIRYADTYLVGAVDKTQTSYTIKEGTKWIGSSAFNNCTNLTSITIPDSVTEIGSYAFGYCSGLTSIIIPDSVTSIGNNAFVRCSSLTSIVIPDSVTSIGYEAFYNCLSLTSITIDNGTTIIPYNAFSGCTNLPIVDNIRYAGTYLIDAADKTLSTYTIKEGTKVIGRNAFYNCKNLTSITIPDSVTSIGSSAFEHCSGLTSIVIPSSVTKIEDNAFFNCYNLQSIVINNEFTHSSFDNICDSISRIENFSLKESNDIIILNNCLVWVKKDFSNVVIPDSVTSIGGSAFYNCTSLTSITIPDSVTSIGGSAFYNCTSLTSITIPDSVTSIGSYAFARCSSLTSITIPDSVTSIGDSAFARCSSLTSVTIGSGVTSISNYAFSACTRLTSIDILDSVTSIGDSAFASCTSLTSFVILDSVTSIGSSAFYNCTSLTSITIPDSVTEIGSYAFQSCTSLTSATFNRKYTTHGMKIFQNCNKLSSITFTEKIEVVDMELYGSVGQAMTHLEIPDSVKLICQPSTYAGLESNIKTISIPNSVKILGSKAFSGFKNLTTINGGDNIMMIGSAAFSGCTVFNPTIPSTVKYLDSLETFEKSGIKELNLPNTCVLSNNLTQICYDCQQLEKVIIPESVSVIGVSAFTSCENLTNVKLHSNVTQILDYAFTNDTKLESITSLAIKAPSLKSGPFTNVGRNGTLYYPKDSSGYLSWMSKSAPFLGYYGWTSVEIE